MDYLIICISKKPFLSAPSSTYLIKFSVLTRIVIAKTKSCCVVVLKFAYIVWSKLLFVIPFIALESYLKLFLYLKLFKDLYKTMLQPPIKLVQRKLDWPISYAIFNGNLFQCKSILVASSLYNEGNNTIKNRLYQDLFNHFLIRFI